VTEIVRYIVTETLATGQPSATPAETRQSADQLVRFLREFEGARVYLPLQDRQVVMESRRASSPLPCLHRSPRPCCCTTRGSAGARGIGCSSAGRQD